MLQVKEPPSIRPSELAARRDENQSMILLDVRPPAEHRAVHLDGVVLEPLDQFDASSWASSHQLGSDTSVYVFCQSGKRATMAVKKFHAAGVENAVVVEGGLQAWMDAGLPVIRGKNVMSLERQVRIAAGTLVFVGTILSVGLSPWWLILPGFVGAGLVFAGLTDTCGMGMLIAKMPWNR